MIVILDELGWDDPVELDLDDPDEELDVDED